ncbi:MAG: M24 family metallopeptidase [Chloroflexota bacterium]
MSTPGHLTDPMPASTRQSIVEERLERLRALVSSKDADAALLSSRANVSWATAGGQHHIVMSSETGVAGLLVTRDRAWLVAPSIETARLAAEEVPDLGIEVVPVPWWEREGIADAVGRLTSGGRVLSDAELAPDLRAMRSVLGASDQDRLMALGRVAERAIGDALADIEPGQSEDALAASLVGRLVGVRAPVVLVAADDRIARYRHPLPSGSAIRRRVMVVVVAEAWGLHVAATRFREFEEPTADLARRIDAVAGVHRAMIDATTIGATLGDVFATAQAAYAEAGVPDEWQDHHQGGTIAYQGREVVAVPDDPTRIEPGMAFAWNPSIAGAKAEDTFVVTVDGDRRFVTGSAPDAAGGGSPPRP